MGVIRAADDLAKAKELQEKFKQKDFELKQDQFNELVQDEAASPDDIFVTLCKDNGVCVVDCRGRVSWRYSDPGLARESRMLAIDLISAVAICAKGKNRDRVGGARPRWQKRAGPRWGWAPARFRAGPALMPPRPQLSLTRSTLRARAPSHTTRRCVRVATGDGLGPPACCGCPPRVTVPPPPRPPLRPATYAPPR